MKIAVIQASTQISKNNILFQETKQAVVDKNWQVFNFGVTEKDENFSYVQIAICVAILLNSGAVDFVVTGCSSGNGMAIAANSLPNVTCGYLPTPSDAYLFGRINQGNCASLSLGLNYGWAGELNLRFILEKLFEEPLNIGYPKESAERKKNDASTLRKIKKASHHDIISILSKIPTEIVEPIFNKKDLISFILENGTNKKLLDYMIRNFSD